MKEILKSGITFADLVIREELSRGRWSGEVDGMSVGGAWKDAIAEPGSWYIGFTAFGEILPYHENKISLDKTVKDKWGLPLKFSRKHIPMTKIPDEWLLAMASGNSLELEVRIKEIDADIFNFICYGSYQSESRRSLVKWGRVTFTDIDDQKQIEKKKDEFLTIASHELKTPLTSIKAYIQLLERTLNVRQNSATSKYLSTVQNQVSKLNSLIADLLDISKIDNGKLKMNKKLFNFENLLSNVVDTIYHTHENSNIRIEREGDVIDQPVFGDEIRIEQVLINYLTNAIKYSPDSKRVIIKTEQENTQIKVDVTDFGIEEDDLGSLAGSLNDMTDALKSSFDKLNNNNWRQTGLVRLNEILVGNKSQEVLAEDSLSHLTNYGDCVNGAFYLLENDLIRLKSAYALEDRMTKTLEIGEGMAEDYVVSFSNGKMKVNHILLLPVILNGMCIGVIELGSAHKFDVLKIGFFKEASSTIALALAAAESRKQVQILLEETQAQAEELQAQHSELENLNTELEVQTQKLQASEEELRVQQEELLQSNQELEERSKLLEEKNHLIAERNLEIQKAEELALSTKYKSEFLANMSHELRTPLNSILLLSSCYLKTQTDNLNEEPDRISKGYTKLPGDAVLSLLMKYWICRRSKPAKWNWSISMSNYQM
ncbi:hypothetical protein FQR65_LT17036 [Abscondita terminalis]|nr:hypothetical protein FQR65_LT17036 [Abscondita terminalis]